MTTHQDNAARLARLAQFVAIVTIVLAAGVFLFLKLDSDITSSDRAGIDPGSGVTGPGAPASTTRFRVPEEDWTLALGPLGASHDPLVESDDVQTVRNPTFGFGEDDPDPDPTINRTQRPLIRYLGSLGDNDGLAALISFAGKQRFLRVGQEFDDEYEITEITPESVTVSDGFVDYTYELSQAILEQTLPNQALNRMRNNRATPNPNAFPGGRTQPQRPGVLPNEQAPPPQDDEKKEDGGSPA
jgi:hypothetical protein